MPAVQDERGGGWLSYCIKDVYDNSFLLKKGGVRVMTGGRRARNRNSCANIEHIGRSPLVVQFEAKRG